MLRRDVDPPRAPKERRELPGGGTMLKVGDVAPDFTLESQRGASVQLSKLRGKTVVLWFYPKADTPG
jgi:peroxiredoxin Q/BCP